MPTLAQAVAASGSGSAAMAILGSSIYRNCTAVDRWFLWALSSPLLLWSQTRDCSAREATETGAESAIKEGGSLHSMVVYRETGPNKCQKNGDAIQKNLFIHFRHNAYEYQCVPVCVCAESLGDRFAILVAYFCAPKNNYQLFPLFAAALSVCECVSLCVFACKLQLMIFIFLTTRCSLPRPKYLRIFLLILCPLSLSLSFPLSLPSLLALSVWLLSCQIVSLSLPLLLLQFRFFYILHRVMKQRGYHKVAAR